MGAARRFVTSRLAASGHRALIDTAALLVSELVTNALLHARSPVVVAVSETGAAVRVEVVDGSAVEPRRRRHGLVSGTGRGLQLVEQLAHGWGAERRADGKSVWFELRDGAASTVPDLDFFSRLDDALPTSQVAG